MVLKVDYCLICCNDYTLLVIESDGLNGRLKGREKSGALLLILKCHSDGNSFRSLKFRNYKTLLIKTKSSSKQHSSSLTLSKFMLFWCAQSSVLTQNFSCDISVCKYPLQCLHSVLAIYLFHIFNCTIVNLQILLPMSSNNPFMTPAA